MGESWGGGWGVVCGGEGLGVSVKGRGDRGIWGGGWVWDGSWDDVVGEDGGG